MDKSLLTKKITLGLCLLSLTYAEPQLTFGLGQTTLQNELFRYKANQASLEYTFNPYSRLQFGAKYDNTSAVVSQRTTYNNYGWLATLKFLLNTTSSKTPYFGFNFGWLNSTLAAETMEYSARGSLTGESIGGYSFVIDELNRLNIEYRNRYIMLKLPDREMLRLETIALSWSVILGDYTKEPEPDRGISKTEALATKKEYLGSKIVYNNQQIARYDDLIAKYNQKILNEGSNETLTKERDFLIQQKKELEETNQQMLELRDR